MDKIKKVYNLKEELEELEKKQQNLVSEAQKSKEKKADEKRTEGDLWEEFFYRGLDSEQAKALEKLHPEAIKAIKARSEKEKEFNDLMFKAFGTHHQAMTMFSIFNLVNRVCDYKIKNG